MRKPIFGLMVVALLISACGGGQTVNTPEPTPVEEIVTTAEPTNAPEPTLMPTDVPPTETPTPEPTPEPTQEPFEVTQDVPYVVDGDFKQKLDVYLPVSGDGPFPTVLLLHGGWDSKRDMAPLARYLAERGYAALSINHRDMPYVTYPAPVQDTFCALAWVHANADAYGFDAEHVFAAGHSTGGSLVAMLGVVDDPALFLQDCPHALPESNWVRGVATYTGIFDYVRVSSFSDDLYNYIVEYMGGTWTEIPETWTEASPATWIDGSEPPFLLVHGAADRDIFPRETIAFAAMLKDAGVNVEQELVGGASHGEIIRSQYFELVETFVATLLEQE